jgi:hypothetical protein
MNYGPPRGMFWRLPAGDPERELQELPRGAVSRPEFVHSLRRSES